MRWESATATVSASQRLHCGCFDGALELTMISGSSFADIGTNRLFAAPLRDMKERAAVVAAVTETVCRHG